MSLNPSSCFVFYLEPWSFSSDILFAADLTDEDDISKRDMSVAIIISKEKKGRCGTR